MMQVTIVNIDGKVQEVDFLKLLKENKRTLLYFYPKDNTLGCTTEAKDFSEYRDEFEKKGIKIIWVSKDSDKSHCSFMEKENLRIDLISDQDLVLHKKYAAWGEKKNYGKVYEGTIRSTFLLDAEGIVMLEWRNVKAKGHAERVLSEIKE